MKGYSFNYDSEKHAVARGSGMNISPKHAIEVCKAIKGWNIERAKGYLERVVLKKQAVPFRKFNGKVGHRKGDGFGPGRYPIKAAAAILKIIESAEANAENLGKDVEILWIRHIAASRGAVTMSRFARAYGRTTAKRRESVNLEVILEEKE